MTVLREGLLRGRVVALAGAVPTAVSAAAEGLGASLHVLELGTEADEEHGQRWARARAPLHALLYDASAAFGQGGQVGLRAALDDGWSAVRAVAGGALIPAGDGGTIVLVGPRPDAGAHAEAARAGLENMARTLSVEWARYAITTTMVAPGSVTADVELAELLCFLLSPAGAYLSGCRFTLGQRAQS